MRMVVFVTRTNHEKTTKTVENDWQKEGLFDYLKLAGLLPFGNLAELLDSHG